MLEVEKDRKLSLRSVANLLALLRICVAARAVAYIFSSMAALSLNDIAGTTPLALRDRTMIYVKARLFTLIVFLAVDYVWVNHLAHDFFVSKFGILLRDSVNF